MIDHEILMRAWRATQSSSPKATRLSVDDIEEIGRRMVAGESNEKIREIYRIAKARASKIRALLGLPPLQHGRPQGCPPPSPKKRDPDLDRRQQEIELALRRDTLRVVAEAARRRALRLRGEGL